MDVEKVVNDLVRRVDMNIRLEKYMEAKKERETKKKAKIERLKERDRKRVEKAKKMKEREKEKARREKIMKEVQIEKQLFDEVEKTLLLDEHEQMQKEEALKQMIKLLSNACKKSHNHMCQHLKSKKSRKEKRDRKVLQSVSVFSSPKKVIVEDDIQATVEIAAEDGIPSGSQTKTEEVRSEALEKPRETVKEQPPVNVSPHINVNGFSSEFAKFVHTNEKQKKQFQPRKREQSAMMKNAKKLMDSLPKPPVKRPEVVANKQSEKPVLKNNVQVPKKRPDVTVTPNLLIFTPPNEVTNENELKPIVAPPVLPRTHFDSRLPGFDTLQSNTVANDNSNVVNNSNSFSSSDSSYNYNNTEPVSFQNLRLKTSEMEFSNEQGNYLQNSSGSTFAVLKNVEVQPMPDIAFAPKTSEITSLAVGGNYGYMYPTSTVTPEQITPVAGDIVENHSDDISDERSNMPHYKKVPAILRKSKINITSSESPTHYFTHFATESVG